MLRPHTERGLGGGGGERGRSQEWIPQLDQRSDHRERERGWGEGAERGGWRRKRGAGQGERGDSDGVKKKESNVQVS